MFHRHYTTGRYRGQNKQERAIMLCMTSWHHHASLPHPSPLMFLPNTKGYPCNTDTKGWKTNPFPPVGSSKEWLPVRAVSIKHFTFHWVCLLQAVLHPHLLVCPLLPCYILKGKSSQHWTQVTECASMLKPPQICSSTSTLKPPLVCSSTIHLLATQVQNKKLMFHAQRQATGLHLVTFLGLVHWSWRNQMSGPHLLILLGLVPWSCRNQMSGYPFVWPSFHSLPHFTLLLSHCSLAELKWHRSCHQISQHLIGPVPTQEQAIQRNGAYIPSSNLYQAGVKTEKLNNTGPV